MIPQEEKQSVCARTHTHTPRIWKILFCLFFTLKNFSFSLSIIGAASIRGRSDNVFALSSIGLKIQDLKRFPFKGICPKLVCVNFMDENTQRQRERERGKWKEEIILLPPYGALSLGNWIRQNGLKPRRGRRQTLIIIVIFFFVFFFPWFFFSFVLLVDENKSFPVSSLSQTTRATAPAAAAQLVQLYGHC